MPFIPNPAFPADRSVIDTDRARMVASPVKPERPIVVLGGWRAPSHSPRSAHAILKPLVSGNDDDFLVVAYPTASSVESAATVALARIAARWPGQRDFDIVAISMGGLVARHLASGGAHAEAASPVTIHRIFTLATPHRGAALARLVRPDAAASAMRPGSAWLSRLDERTREAPYELVCYATLRDWWVGAKNTAPPGHTSIWLDQDTLFGKTLSHFAINGDVRILADIARRLRGEPAIARVGDPPPIQ
jgi:hypothetical protein